MKIPYKAIRTQLNEAETKMRNACEMMRRHGLPENADELTRTVKHLRVWTQKDGWLDILESQGDEAWQHASRERSA